MSHGEIARTLGISPTASLLELVARAGKAEAPARGGWAMMDNRWRTTRERLGQEASGGDAAGLWSRIAESRGAGRSVDLPSTDPHRSAGPMLFGILAVAAVVAIAVPRDTSGPAPIPGVPAEDPEASALFHWLPTPAQAQSVRASALPPIDPPRFASHAANAGVSSRGRRGWHCHRYDRDGYTQHHSSSLDGREVVALIRTGQIASIRPLQAIDSLVMASDGSFLFWHYQISALTPIA
jgi:hypothetical protein